MHEYKFKNMTFSKDGGLDELLAMDRYAVTSYDGYEVGDTVVAIIDERGSKKIGEINNILDNDEYEIIARTGESHIVKKELIQKPLETEPHQLWDRWSKGGASVEKTESKRKWLENELRWLFDGYRYSMGGRIQLMLGQEHVTGERANLTAYNCFVAKSPEGSNDPLEQFLNVLDVAYYEASIMRRGGGVGLNITAVNTVEGTGRKEDEFIVYLDEKHTDSEELQDRILLNKFEGVSVSTEKPRGGSRTAYITVEDSVDEIFESLNEMVENAYDKDINRIVLDFNSLRERNAIVKGVNGRSSGAVSWAELFVLVAKLLQEDKVDNVDFAEIFSHITNLIIQGGSRRGALMLINEVESPTVNKFIERKRKAGFLEGANISVGISDSFMDKVISGVGPQITSNEAKEAQKTWNNLIESAWASAEPGIVWLERYNKESNSWYYNEIVATNPCGEQGLPEWGVCNLGHFVLPRFYDEETNDVEWDDLEKAIHLAVRLQDNIIDYTDYFLEENREVQLSERRVGIGSMGLGTLLVKMGLRYGSEEGNEFTDELYKFIAKNAYEASIDLAEEKGAFPEFEYDKFVQSGFMKRLLNEFPELDEGLKKHGIRNVTLLTQAPTGSTATMLENVPMMRDDFGGVSTGIEPYFSWSYWRASRLGNSEQIVPIAKDYMDANGIKEVEDLPEHFVTAMELTPEEHVGVQAVIQKWTDSSISKTANVPSEFTVEQTSDLYLKGYELGLKGVTIYRDGSRDTQVLATKEEDARLEGHVEAETLAKLKEEVKKDAVEVSKGPRVDTTKKSLEKTESGLPKIDKLPARLFGMREKVKYQSGERIAKAYIHIYVDESGHPVELWIEPTNASDKDMADALGRMTTQFLRYGVTEDNVTQAIKHLQAGKTLMSLPNIVGRVLGNVYYGKIEMPTFGNKQEEKPKKKEFKLQECVSCGEEAYDVPNCVCYACGYSSCN